MREIIHEFPITEKEFLELDRKFSKLCWHAAHELKKKNSNNNYIDDAEDIKQELQMSMLRAGSYYKRQIYIEKFVPKEEKPDKEAALKIDSKFATYCKAIVWNGQKSMGKKITREKSIRSGMVSLSEFDYLQTNS